MKIAAAEITLLLEVMGKLIKLGRIHKAKEKMVVCLSFGCHTGNCSQEKERPRLWEGFP